MTKTTFLLAGHGSRNREGNDEIERFADQWRQKHPDWRIEVCFIEHADVLLNDGLDNAAKGAQRVVLIPFILNAAGHVKMELPAAIESARERHPNVEFVVTRHLGMGREIFDVLQKQLDRLMKALDVPDPQTTGVILAATGDGRAAPGQARHDADLRDSGLSLYRCADRTHRRPARTAEAAVSAGRLRAR